MTQTDSPTTPTSSPSPTPPSVLQPAATQPQSQLAQLRRQIAEGVPQAFRESFANLLQFRSVQRDIAWRRKSGLSPQEYWDALGTNAVSVATISNEFEAFLEEVSPGITKDDAGVPDDYTLTFNADGSAVCTEKTTA